MLILGNAVALVASLVMVYAGILKKKKDIVLCYCIELALYSISNILLGGIPGAIINVFGVLGNFLEYKNKLNNYGTN